MKVRMLFIVQYCYLDYSRPVTGLSLARALCRERAAYVRQLIYTVLLVLRISLRPLHRAGSFAICLSFHSSQTMLTPPSDEKLTRPVFDLKRADSDGHIILYVLKYFLDRDTYQVPEAKEIRFFFRSFDIFYKMKGIFDSLFTAKSLSSPTTTLTDAWFSFLRRQAALFVVGSWEKERPTIFSLALREILEPWRMHPQEPDDDRDRTWNTHYNSTACLRV